MAEPKKTRAKAKKELMAPITLGIDPEVIKRADELAPNPRTAPMSDVIRYWARLGLSEFAIASKLDMGATEFVAKMYAFDEDGSRPWRLAFEKGRGDLEADVRVQRMYLLHTTESEKTRHTILQDQIDEITRASRISNTTDHPSTSPNEDAVDVVFKTIEPSSDERKAQVLELITERERKAQ